MGHEEAFVKAFIRSEKRARWAQALADHRRRGEFLDQLNQNLPYLHEFATDVPGSQDFPGELLRLLQAKGAGPRCHVIADGLKIDGRELPLAEALNEIFLNRFGAVLSCLPGRLAYYKPESPRRGVLLERLPR